MFDQSILLRKKERGGSGLLSQNDTIDGYAY